MTNMGLNNKIVCNFTCLSKWKPNGGGSKIENKF